ncbi:biotin carboxyl carrier protein of acetyl-CoA carboxylase, chloroplastic-like [Silene latifolia]|uniref:biotin carboxyl carrier protein of acetyl-CoA carboxylase, chloroplastic-like n=1 Tax=Silene latifolia TaxID=37657 RepID=UPI003D780063
MAASFPATTSSSSTVVAKISTTRRHFYHHSPPKLSFPVSPKPKLRLFSSKPLPSRMVAVKSQLNKVAVEGSNNAPATSEAKSGLPVKETKIDEPTKGSSATELSEESISDFINQVSDLVKLVDCRDIVELQLKQHDCEILIRKKLAIEPTQSPPPYAMMQSPPPMASPTSHAPPPASVPALPAPKPAAPAATSAKSSVPPTLSPMAGTFYRCPGPGEPPFVKVGDKVQKGQVLCIIEAMKLMNEIQAEQAGTIVEVIAEDAKPVSKDSPLFAIQP